MWVWDYVAKECLYVVRPFITTGVRVKYFTCLGIWNLEKIKKLNLNANEYLKNCDSNTFFNKLSYDFVTGITGTNVMDFIIVLKEKNNG